MTHTKKNGRYNAHLNHVQYKDGNARRSQREREHKILLCQRTDRLSHLPIAARIHPLTLLSSHPPSLVSSPQPPGPTIALTTQGIPLSGHIFTLFNCLSLGPVGPPEYFLTLHQKAHQFSISSQDELVHEPLTQRTPSAAHPPPPTPDPPTCP